MESINELRFSVSDRVKDGEVGVKHVPLSLLGEFQKDVCEFLRGSVRDVEPDDVMISLEDGSLALIASGLRATTTLWVDLERLQSSRALRLVDPKRAAVIERWQTAALQNPHRKYLIAAPKMPGIRLSIDVSTDFRRAEEVWMSVEKYIHGKVLDWGGKTRPNVHLELNDGSVLTVSATQTLLKQETQNLLYRSTLLHIRAEENLLTGALRNPVLLAFETQQPAYDEAEFREMVRRGTAAWSDTPDATKWVENLRAGQA